MSYRDSIMISWPLPPLDDPPLPPLTGHPNEMRCKGDESSCDSFRSSSSASLLSGPEDVQPVEDINTRPDPLDGLLPVPPDTSEIRQVQFLRNWYLTRKIFNLARSRSVGDIQFAIQTLPLRKHDRSATDGPVVAWKPGVASPRGQWAAAGTVLPVHQQTCIKGLKRAVNDTHHKAPSVPAPVLEGTAGCKIVCQYQPTPIGVSSRDRCKVTTGDTLTTSSEHI
ncbi:hypothetical protein HDU93_000811 [Gonapodya sp. JEL0774]|nr:hypothetical protein HDU93_000811 [Gonapodya sp. JEL0774]